MGATNGGNSDLSLLNRLVDIHLSEDQIKEVLDIRAATLAQTAGEEQEESAVSQYVSFKLGQERYALEVRLVEEIQLIKELTRIPCTPAFVYGAVNVRGRILPVIDIKSFFGLTPVGLTPTSKIIVVEAGELQLGVIADQVDEVMDIHVDEIKTQIETLSGSSEEFIKGVTDDAVIILDMAKLAQDKRMIIREDV